MSLFSRDPILLTPGPLTTSLATKTAMLRDWGSWDANFNAVTAEVRKKLVDIIHGRDTHVCVPMQGSGTFSVEAAINTLVPRNGHVLVLINGAYGPRLAKLTRDDGPQGLDVRDGRGRADDAAGRRPAAQAPTRRSRMSASSTARPRPASSIRCRRSPPWSQRHGRSLIVDAMSSFGAIGIDARTTTFDALIAASGKCIEGPPGMGFVLVRRSVLEKCAGNSTSLSLDLHDQWTYMEKTTQWRYTPPTHVVVAFNAALDQHVAEGGQPARLARYTKNCETLVAGLAELGFQLFLKPEIQAPIILTFHAPPDPRVQVQGVLRRASATRASSSIRASSRRSRRSASAASAPSVPTKCGTRSTPCAIRCARWASGR